MTKTNRIQTEQQTTDEALAFLQQNPAALTTDLGPISVPAAPASGSSLKSTDVGGDQDLSDPILPMSMEELAEEFEDPTPRPMAEEKASSAGKTSHHSSILSAKSAILMTLLSGPASGSQIKRSMIEASQGFIAFRSGSLYPGLATLKEMGLIQVDREEATLGPPMTIYSLTERGHAIATQERQVLRAFLQTPAERALANWMKVPNVA